MSDSEGRAFQTQQVFGRRLKTIICLPWSLVVQRRREIQGVGMEGGCSIEEEKQKGMNVKVQQK